MVNLHDRSEIKWCSVNLSDVFSRGKRLEASVFDVEAKRARQIIFKGKFPVAYIGGENGLTTSYTCARFKRIWLEKSDLPIYQPSSIVDIKPIPDGYISKLTRTNIEKLKVHKGQILLTCSGTIGKATYVSETLDNKIFSHDLLRINCNEPSDAGYIYTYLISKLGNKILLTNSYGAVITHIESEHLSTVPIPNPSDGIKLKINDLIVKSFTLRDESNKLIDDATKLLIEELKLPPIEKLELDLYDPKASVETYSVKLSNLNGRLDGSYHEPIVQAIVDSIKNSAGELTTLKDSRFSKDVVLAGRFKRVYVNENAGVKFVGGKEVTQLNPSTEKYLSKSKHKKQLKNSLGIKENSILVPARGSIGTVVLTCKHFIGYALSDNVLQILSSSDICGYLFIFLNSDYGRALIKRYVYGGVVDAIDPTHIQNVAVPILKNVEIQKLINEMALEANQKRYEAYLAEQEALRIMNEEVIFAK